MCEMTPGDSDEWLHTHQESQSRPKQRLRSTGIARFDDASL